MRERTRTLTFAALLFFCSAMSVAAASIRFADDFGRGVKMQIFLLAPNSAPVLLGSTNDDGLFTLEKACVAGNSIEADPVSHSVYQKALVQCPPAKKDVLVSSVEYVAAEVSNADAFAKEGKPAAAALLYNDVAVRVAVSDPTVANDYRVKVITLMGKRFGVTNALAFDSNQGSSGKQVISTDLRDAITAFQNANNLSTNGLLDFGTLSAASGIKAITPYLVTAPKARAGAKKRYH